MEPGPNIRIPDSSEIMQGTTPPLSTRGPARGRSTDNSWRHAAESLVGGDHMVGARDIHILSRRSNQELKQARTSHARGRYRYWLLLLKRQSLFPIEH